MNNLRSFQLNTLIQKMGMSRGAVFGSILMIALVAFEAFNYSTTSFALTDLLSGNLTFLGVGWATILAIAFCGIDFAGIARLYTPEQDASQEPVEVWYLFGAWLLASAMNAILTWWGVAVAINGHTALGSALIGRETMTKVVPIFVAIMVWLIRLLIIGTFSMAGDRLFSMASTRTSNRLGRSDNRESAGSFGSYQPQNLGINNNRPFPKPFSSNSLQTPGHTEPTYQPVGMAAKPRNDENKTWR